MPSTTTAKPQAARLHTTPAAAGLRPSRAAPKPAKPRAASKPQPLVLSAVEIVGKTSCVTNDDSKKVFNCIHRAFKKKQPVEVSFRGADMVTLPFMQEVIGKLYEKYPEKEIRPLVKVTGLDEGGKLDLEYAVRHGKRYFADPVGYMAHVKRVVKELKAEGLC